MRHLGRPTGEQSAARGRQPRNELGCWQDYFCTIAMNSDLYPAPQVNWYPGAHTAGLTNPSGLSFPALDSAAGSSFAGYGVGSFGTAEPNGLSFTGLGGGAMSEYARSEYGRPVGGGPDMMSFYTIAASQGFPRGQQPGNTKAPAENGYLVVNVDSALDLTPSDPFGAHHYCATAGYPGETEEEMYERRTPVVKANPSPTTPQKENCVLHKRIMVPYNPRQQFVMVSIFEADQLGDTFVGKATLPLAEEKLLSTAPWPLIRDANPNGTLTLNIQVPTCDRTATSNGGGSWGGHPAGMAPQSATSFTSPALSPPAATSPRGNGASNPWAPMPHGAVESQPRESMPMSPRAGPQPQQHYPLERHPQMPQCGQPHVPNQPHPHAHPPLQPLPYPAPEPLAPACAAAAPYGMPPAGTAGPALGSVGNPVAGNGFGADPLGVSRANLPVAAAGYPAFPGRPASLMPEAAGCATTGHTLGAQAPRPCSYIPPPSAPVGGGAMPSHTARSWIPPSVAAAAAAPAPPSAAVLGQPQPLGIGGGAGSSAGLMHLGATPEPQATLSMAFGGAPAPNRYAASMTPSLAAAPHTHCAPMALPEYHSYSCGSQPSRAITAPTGVLGAPVVATTRSISNAASLAAAMPLTGMPVQSSAALLAPGPLGAATLNPTPHYPSASVAHASPLPACYQAGASGAAYNHYVGH